MKKIFGFLGAAALLTLGSCSNENFDEPQGAPETKGDLYFSMVIDQKGTTSTRTETPQQGVEIGKDVENKISSAIVIFAREDKVIYKGTLGSGDITGSSTSGEYNTSFSVNRKTLLEDLETGADKTQTYDIFVIVNPTEDIANSYTVGSELQKEFTLEEDAATYWTDNNFLMSNAKRTLKTIKAEDIPLGTYTTRNNAYPLGEVQVQRAMSRFDIETSVLTFTIVNGEEDGEDETTALQNDVEITFESVALVNQATSAYMFKATSAANVTNPGEVADQENEENQARLWTEFKANPGILFGTETKYNYVFSPVQTSFSLPLFGDNRAKANATDGKLTDKTYDYSTLSYTDLTSLTTDDNVFTHPTTQQPESQGEYKIWRYCMENTNFGKGDADQVHGNSTGLVFKAKMTGKLFTDADGADVYAFNNVILGTAQTLKQYATTEKSDKDDSGVYELVKIAYADAVAKAKAKWATENPTEAQAGQEWDGETNGTLEDLKDYLVKDNHFSVYKATTEQGGAKNYYCYYTYWNRHNDNGQNTIMGQMEFATVRNNVYKIKVNSVARLGHPGDPNDDPDPDDPGTPDEKDSFYCSVICTVLPWEVRMNTLDF